MRPWSKRSIELADPVIRVSVQCPEQLFNNIDPSPFYERDLSPDAESFILAWARSVADRKALKLQITVDEQGAGDGLQHISEAVHQQFRRQSQSASSELHQLFRRGRISAFIGATFLTASVVGSGIVARTFGNSSTSQIVQLGLQLLGWVATWRPIETYLYAWWPITSDRKLYDQLAAMPIEIRGPLIKQR